MSDDRRGVPARAAGSGKPGSGRRAAGKAGRGGQRAARRSAGAMPCGRVKRAVTGRCRGSQPGADGRPRQARQAAPVRRRARRRAAGLRGASQRPSRAHRAVPLTGARACQHRARSVPAGLRSARSPGRCWFRGWPGGRAGRVARPRPGDARRAGRRAVAGAPDGAAVRHTGHEPVGRAPAGLMPALALRRCVRPRAAGRSAAGPAGAGRPRRSALLRRGGRGRRWRAARLGAPARRLGALARARARRPGGWRAPGRRPRQSAAGRAGSGWAARARLTAPARGWREPGRIGLTLPATGGRPRVLAGIPGQRSNAGAGAAVSRPPAATSWRIVYRSAAGAAGGFRRAGDSRLTSRRTNSTRACGPNSRPCPVNSRIG